METLDERPMCENLWATPQVFCRTLVNPAPLSAWEGVYRVGGSASSFVGAQGVGLFLLLH